jgi:hypothetical protein
MSCEVMMEGEVGRWPTYEVSMIDWTAADQSRRVLPCSDLPWRHYCGAASKFFATSAPQLSSNDGVGVRWGHLMDWPDDNDRTLHEQP